MDKKQDLILIVIILTFLSASTAIAAVEISTPSIEFNVDYNNFNDEDQDQVSETFDVVISNTEASSVTVNVEIIGLATRYNVPALNSVSIPSGETRIVTVTIKVPHLESSGEKQIGTVEIRDNTTDALYDSATLIQDTKSMLDLDEIRVNYYNQDGDSEIDTFSSNKKNIELSENVQTGTEVSIMFDGIENLFDKDYDQDKSEFEDIILKIEVDDDDLYADSFDEEYDLNRISAEDYDSFEVTFMIDEEADDKEYIFTIELEAEDGEGAKHLIERELTLKVERNKDDVRITKFEVTPQIISSCEEHVRVDVKIKNFGTRDQDKATIQLFSQSLGIIENIPNIQIEKYSRDENEYSRSFLFNFNKKNLELGKHDLDLNAFINIDDASGSQRKLITIVACDEAETTTKETTTTPENNQQEKKVETKAVSSGEIVTTIEDPYTSEDMLVSLIIISIILLLATIAIFTIILIKNTSEVPKK